MLADVIIPDLYTMVAILAGIASLAAYSRTLVLDMRKRTEEKAEKLKEITDKHNEEFRRYTDEKWKLNHDTITGDIKGLSDKLDKINERQNMVNGNVENIRDDISDVKNDLSFVQEDITELFNDEDCEEDRGRDHDAVSIRRRKDSERNRKKRTIRSDGDWQGKKIHER